MDLPTIFSTSRLSWFQPILPKWISMCCKSYFMDLKVYTVKKATIYVEFQNWILLMYLIETIQKYFLSIKFLLIILNYCKTYLRSWISSAEIKLGAIFWINDLFVKCKWDPRNEREKIDIFWDNAILIIQEMPILLSNIATGETSQDITPFHFFDNFNFHH